MEKRKAVEKLKKQLAEIDELKTIKRFSPDFKKWQRDTEVVIERFFGKDTRHINDFKKVNYSLRLWNGCTPDSEHQRAYVRGLEDANAFLKSFIEEIGEYYSDEKIDTDETKKGGELEPYIDVTRIRELDTIPQKEFDLKKLIQILKEINICYREKCYFGTILLVRALIDHVPPIFGMSKFSEVANNYKGSSSFKELMKHLEESCRKIADQHLHCQIRKSEVLPNRTQVDFKNDVDVLIAEIFRILKT